ncbi:UDP-N-acetylmuramate dehydrogenase [Thermotomaculum hydrothermale]|uniref:UDP-N-acetylenolpyruvoylglucosamine reductase n=1 Tax=Thermotomaculum hydrothermale TaxID=981385 RepID=A0A7R6SYZ8_9BACT|nr:UDP-N-acetylmuramate dehydrogenase [Thermotomaculum hydrothermale]BBB33121.1 UDP-N-acetylmuramate dehydrogenase [Thermotomaculum hydrothermale]
MNRTVRKRLIDFFNFKNIEFFEDFSLKEFTSYKTGGKTEFVVFPDSTEKLKQAFLFAKKLNIHFYILGGGANVIVSDTGVKGIVCITKKLNKISFKEGKIFAEAGVSLEKLADFACGKGISGFEFAYNIPGSVGGAIIMNAGNNYGEFANIICKVRAMGRDGRVFVFRKNLCEFGYRNSIFKRKRFIVLDAVFKGSRSEKAQILSLMKKIKEEREKKFPLEYPNAGSVFKRPKGYYAGKLIEDSGCGGLRVGDAMVSEKHKGFIVNLGNATSQDIKDLISLVQKKGLRKIWC